MNSKKPGYCNEQDIHHVDSRLFRQMGEFIDAHHMIGEGLMIGDVGEYNAKCEYICERFRVDIEQINYKDFNFDAYYSSEEYTTVLCFEVIEHLQNPLFFLFHLKNRMFQDGVLYLSTPHRPKLLWTSRHFIEYSPRHLAKWILEPLDLYVVRKKHLRINHHWSFYLKGIRPMLRLFFNWTVIYEIRKR